MRVLTGGDGTCGFQIGKATGHGESWLGLMLGLGVIDSILKVKIRVKDGDGRRSQRPGVGMAIVSMRRKRRRDGVGRSREGSSVLAGIEGFCSDGGEALFAIPKGGFAWLWDIDGVGLAS